MDRLKGKVIVVTGAAMGQGAQEVRLFVQEGAKVIAGDVALEQLEQLAAEVNGRIPDSVLPVKLDVTSAEDWAAAVKAGVARFGKINGLMNNAGGARYKGSRQWGLRCANAEGDLWSVSPPWRRCWG